MHAANPNPIDECLCALYFVLFRDKVASSTSSTMILFTSFTAATSFIMFGLLPFDYGVLLLVLGFMSTFVGQVWCAIMMWFGVGAHAL